MFVFEMIMRLERACINLFRVDTICAQKVFKYKKIAYLKAGLTFTKTFPNISSHFHVI